MSDSKQNSPFKKAIQNAPFQKWDEYPDLTCVFKEILTLGESEPFDVALVVDVETGEEKFITMSYSIDKAIKIAQSEITEQDIVLDITFLGKTEVKGKPFNKFDISYCSESDYDQSLKSVNDNKVRTKETEIREDNTLTTIKVKEKKKSKK